MVTREDVSNLEYFQARYRIPNGEWSSWGHVVCGVKGHEQELRVAPDRASPSRAAWIDVSAHLPEPGKAVLLDIGKKTPIRALWAAKATVEAGADADESWVEYDEASGTTYCPEGWYEWNEHEETHWAVSATPLRWMSIPVPAAVDVGAAQAETAQAAPAATGLLHDEDALHSIERAADLLEGYAEFIKSDVMAADIERHPYLPEVEGVAEELRELSALAAPLMPCGHSRSLMLRSAETGEPLYCEACDDKSGRRDAEEMELALHATNKELSQ